MLKMTGIEYVGVGSLGSLTILLCATLRTVLSKVRC